jgi:hypothetical protein
LVTDATLDARIESAMPANDDETLLPFNLLSICQKKVTGAFDGGLISSDGGVLLAAADKRLGLIDTLAAIIPDHRDPTLVTHTMSDILRACVFAMACGYPDANDLDKLRRDPAFKLACGRLPESGDDLHSQPTMSRWENGPDERTLIRMGRAMVDLLPAPRSHCATIGPDAQVCHPQSMSPNIRHFKAAILTFLREEVPGKWGTYCDQVTDNFRIISPQGFSAPDLSGV